MDIKSGHVKLLIIIVTIILALMLIKPFIITIILAAVFGYLLWPIHNKLRKKIGDFSSSLLLTASAATILILGTYYGINLLLEESANLYVFLSTLNLSYFGPTAQEFAKLATTKIITFVSDQILTLINIFIAIIIFFASLFYLLKEKDGIYKSIIEHIPFAKDERNKIIKNIIQYLDAFIHVQIVIGLAQGIIAAIGFWLFGLPYPMLAGLAAGVLSILPGIGPYVMYIPLGIGVYYTHGLSTTIGILAYGLILGSIMDYGVRPILYGKKVKMHPLIILLGILGGIKMFGFIGIIIGPIILSIAIALSKELVTKNG
jgi:predicted PurR-regulated permease PerM